MSGLMSGLHLQRVQELIEARTRLAGTDEMAVSRSATGMALNPNPVESFEDIRFLGQIALSGPQGQPDFEDARYWVREIRENTSDDVRDPSERPDFLLATDDESVRFPYRRVMAINLAEFDPNNQVGETHNFGLTTETDEHTGALVHVFRIRAEGVHRYFFYKAAGGGGLKRFTLRGATGDVFIARESGKFIYIAKPYELRQTPFDGKTIDGIKYTYSSPMRRVARKGMFPNIEEETQVYVQNPREGDEIQANPIPEGLDDVLDPLGNPCKWLAPPGQYKWARMWEAPE